MQGKNYVADFDTFVAICKRNKLKLTPQRIAIYNILLQSNDHPSADSVFHSVQKEFSTISFDTVNRTLLTYSQIGIIDIVEGHGNPRRFDANKDDHHHCYCISCGNIIDFQCKEYDNFNVPDKIKKDFTVLNKRVVLTGLCRKCKSKK
jgi:Fur family peroxide stress response transcriptional regulator